MSRIQIDVNAANDFLNELRSYKVKSADQIKELESAIRGIEKVWEDEQGKEFSEKLLSKLRVLEEFNKGLERIERFVDNKVTAASRRLV